MHQNSSDPLKSAVAVLDAYMTGLNRGDEVAVNAACNFPHVRIGRFRADGSSLGVFETIYIVTRQDGHWGIQARSSFAS